MTEQSLKTKAAMGMAWSFLGTFATQGINFIIGIVLARLLMPSDYGLIGMLAILFAISQLFIESGFSSALIQKIDRTEVDYSTIFYFNLIHSFIKFWITVCNIRIINLFLYVLIKDVMNTALEEVVAKYESKNGVIKPIPKK